MAESLECDLGKVDAQRASVIFDLDGVLVNWEDAFTSWMSKQNFTVVKEKEYNQYTRYGITKNDRIT